MGLQHPVCCLNILQQEITNKYKVHIKPAAIKNVCSQNVCPERFFLNTNHEGSNAQLLPNSQKKIGVLKN